MARITDERILMERAIKMLPKGIPASAIKSVECDPYDGTNGGGSYWVYLANGFWCPTMGCHTIHEDTLKELKSMLAEVEIWAADPAFDDPSQGYGPAESAAVETATRAALDRAGMLAQEEPATMTTQEIKAARAALIEAHASTRNDGPTAAVAALVDRIGYDAAREIVALLIVAKGEYDGRISERCRAWAYDLTRTTRGHLMARGIYYADEIHPAHMDQIGRAMMEYTPEPEPAQEATQEPTPEPAPRTQYVRADGEAATDSAREALTWHRAGHDIQVCHPGRRIVYVYGAPQEQPRGRDENRDHCRAIAEDIERYAAGLLHRCPDCGREIELPDDVGDKYRCPGCGQTHDVDDLEQLGIWDYFQDVYDMDWILDSNREYKACRVMIACGGPNIYISTYDKRVELFWWSESATYPLTYAAAEAVDEWAAEYWACCQ